MVESLKDLIVDRLADLHDSVTAHLDRGNPQELLGPELESMRGRGTGRSLVMLALVNDLLRTTQIAFGPDPERYPRALAFAAPFLRTAAKTFALKGLTHFEPYRDLSSEDAAEFLRFYAACPQLFGGSSTATGWSGLQLCRNVAERSRDAELIDRYERLIGFLIDVLESQGVPADTTQQLREFLVDNCTDVRDGLRPHSIADLADLAQRQKELDQQAHALANERESLAVERAALEKLRQKLGEEQRQLATERANLQSRLREAEEVVAERAALWEDREELAAERERLLGERAELEALRASLTAVRMPEQMPERSQESEPVAAVLPAIEATRRLAAAVIANDLSAMRAALADGADVDDCDSEQAWQTPLILAASRGHVDAVRLLLDQGADSACGDLPENNALLAAVVGEHALVVELLGSRVPSTVLAAFSKLIAILRDDNSPMACRRLSVRALGRLGPDASQVLPTLLGLLESESRELARESAEALAAIDRDALDEQAIPYLTRILDGLAGGSTRGSAWIANLHATRADLYRLTDRPRAALADYETSLHLWPDADENWRLRAIVSTAVGQDSLARAWDEYQAGLDAERLARHILAVRHWERSAELDPLCPWPRERLAWLLATCPEDAVRNSTRAVVWARDACRLAQSPHWRFLRALAAALARHGEFSEAVETARQAFEAAPLVERAAIKSLVERFERHEPITAPVRASYS